MHEYKIENEKKPNTSVVKLKQNQKIFYYIYLLKEKQMEKQVDLQTTQNGG